MGHGALHHDLRGQLFPAAPCRPVGCVPLDLRSARSSWSTWTRSPRRSNGMRLAARAIATVGFVGYAPVAPGSAGSLVGWVLGLILASVESAPFTPHAPAVVLGVSAVVIGCFLVGVLVSGTVERQTREHDPSYVVIDEFVGMWAVVQACP